MTKTLDKKKWSHFTDKHFLESLVENRENLLLVGPPKTGKSELVRELFDPKSTLRINCLIFDNLVKLTSDICEKITKWKKPENLRPNSTFAQLIQWLILQKELPVFTDNSRVDLNKTTLIFENAHTLLDISYEQCSDFFKVYSRFVEELSNLLDIQTIVISRSEMPLDYFKVCLPYPTNAKLQEFVSHKFDQKWEKLPLDICKPFIAKIKPSFVTTILEFEIIVHDFDSFDLLSNKIFSQLKRAMRGQNKVHLVSQAKLFLKDYPSVQTLLSVFFFNIKAIYYSNKELREMTQNFADADKNIKDYGIFNSISHMQKKMLESMPTVACYILLACYIASSIPQSKDHTVLGICKAKCIGKKSNWQKQIKHKAFSTVRAVSIVEVLMENSSEREMLNEHQLLYHSTEFYMIFDFFERISWIKESGIGQIPKSYKFTCDPSFVSVLIRKLGLDQTEYFFHGN